MKKRRENEKLWLVNKSATCNEVGSVYSEIGEQKAFMDVTDQVSTFFWLYSDGHH